MTDKEKLKVLWEDVAKLQLLVRSGLSLMNEGSNVVNVKELIKRIDVWLIFMQETLEKPTIKVA